MPPYSEVTRGSRNDCIYHVNGGSIHLGKGIPRPGRSTTQGTKPHTAPPSPPSLYKKDNSILPTSHCLLFSTGHPSCSLGL